MNLKRIQTARGMLAAGLLIASTGLAQAYAVPPTPHADLGIGPAGLGALLWIPLVLLMLALAAGLAWSLRAERTGQSVRREPSRPVSAPRPAARVAAKERPRHKPRRWRSTPAAAH